MAVSHPSTQSRLQFPLNALGHNTLGAKKRRVRSAGGDACEPGLLEQEIPKLYGGKPCDLAAAKEKETAECELCRMYLHIVLWAGLVYACHFVRTHLWPLCPCDILAQGNQNALTVTQRESLYCKRESLYLKWIFRAVLFLPPTHTFVAPVSPGRRRTFSWRWGV